jgi:hypothetical protein
MNNGIIRRRTGKVEFVGPLFVGVGVRGSRGAAPSSADPMFGGRPHRDEPEDSMRKMITGGIKALLQETTNGQHPAKFGESDLAK